ncbi:MAG: hypothetical protein HC872_09740, partial [Gammaproteobacteria bacterium]|nr:hypothetical protein [Gammaproteobacteria bacterium]
MDETTWEAGFAYSPDPGTRLEAFYGKRFFGTSYRASARRTAQFLQLSAAYDEGPVTQAQQLLAQARGGFQVTPIAPLDPGTNPAWLVFAFSNPTSERIVRWLVAPRYTLADSRVVLADPRRPAHRRHHSLARFPPGAAQERSR